MNHRRTFEWITSDYGCGYNTINTTVSGPDYVSHCVTDHYRDIIITADCTLDCVSDSDQNLIDTETADHTHEQTIGCDHNITCAIY